MTIRPIDDNDDMMPVYTLNQMDSGAKCVAQVIRDNLLLPQGEWWEDRELGIDVPGFLLDDARRNDTSYLAEFITMTILSTEGVDSIANVNVDLQGHKMTYSCTVIVGDESEDLEVDMSAVLGS